MDLTRRDALALAALAPLMGAAAQPELDLEVPYVPTPPELVEAMLDLAGLSAEDYLIDLGCGDGRIAIAAARRGARALGVDIDPNRIAAANFAVQMAGLETRARFRRQDLFRTPISEASVIALYLLPRINLQLRPRLLTELRAGARIVSHAFDMGDWRPEATDTLDNRRIFLWIVPAIAGGAWTVTEADGTPWRLDFEQSFQDLTGTLTGNGQSHAITRATLRGPALAFTAAGRDWTGVVGDADIAGANGAWRAERAL